MKKKEKIKKLAHNIGYAFLFLLLITSCGGNNSNSGASSHDNTTDEETVKEVEPITSSEFADGYINGYGYVDLNLPSGTLWATCNVGAKSPEEFGDYFAWGEISPKESYDEENSKTYNEIDYGFCISGNPSLDAATANWGSPWQMPSAKHFNELRKYCSVRDTTINGVAGSIVYHRKNKKSFFVPFAGRMEGTEHHSLLGDFPWVDVWTGDPVPGNDYVSIPGSVGLTYVVESSIRSERYEGLPIRAVVNR